MLFYDGSHKGLGLYCLMTLGLKSGLMIVSSKA